MSAESLLMGRKAYRDRGERFRREPRKCAVRWCRPLLSVITVFHHIAVQREQDGLLGLRHAAVEDE
jgi:hypothetical protein